MRVVLLLRISYCTKLLSTDVGRIVVQHGNTLSKMLYNIKTHLLKIRTALILTNRTNQPTKFCCTTNHIHCPTFHTCNSTKFANQLDSVWNAKIIILLWKQEDPPKIHLTLQITPMQLFTHQEFCTTCWQLCLWSPLWTLSESSSSRTHLQ